MNEEPQTRSGFVAIVGRPNVGKSTLLNALLGKKLSITSRKPQTTRHRWLGVKTSGLVQTIYVDTPGIQSRDQSILNDYMNRAARSALVDVDVVIFVVDALKWNSADEAALKLLSPLSCPIILVVNKVDTIFKKSELLHYLPVLGKRHAFQTVIPLSSKRKTNLAVLESTINHLLPLGPHYFPPEQETDRSLHFRMAEIIREKMMRLFGDELPYVSTVEIQDYNTDLNVPLIQATIFVEKEGQKVIVIGKNGEKIKKIGIQARFDLEALTGLHLNLKLWVKVRPGWSTDRLALKKLGYDDDAL